MSPSEEEDRWFGDFILSRLTSANSGSYGITDARTNSISLKFKEEL
jgi:hypothetical protein